MDALNMIQRLGQGRTLEDLAEAMANVADEVVASGKPGEVTLKLKFSVSAQGEAMVMVAETITRKVPARAPRGQILYALEGWLYSKDPRQPELPAFRPVEQVAAEVRQTDDAAPAVREA